MRILLVPGFWLNAASWGPVTTVLEGAGYDVVALTLPGMSSRDEDRRTITWSDHVAAVFEEVDRHPDDVVLVGHSAGGALVHAALDARRDQVRHVIYVDALPLGSGECVNAELPVVDAEIPLPEWSLFSPEDLRDLDENLRARFREVAVPVPWRVARDPQVLTNPRRYEVPVTVVACEFSAADVREWIGAGEPGVAELAAMHHVRFVELPTGHWPQFTRPVELADALLDILRGVEADGAHAEPGAP